MRFDKDREQRVARIISFRDRRIDGGHRLSRVIRTGRSIGDSRKEPRRLACGAEISRGSFTGKFPRALEEP